jgi:hypothetical protein
MATRTSGKPRRRKKPAIRAGMPSKDSVREIVTKVAPTGLRFRILKTTEMDSYDKPRRSKKRGT